MEQTYAITIFLTIVGFAVLAAVLLIPVYRFMLREQQKGEEWNEELRRRPPPASGDDSA